MATSAYDLSRAIINGNFNAQELDEIAQSVRYARSQLGRKVTFELKRGDNVKFTGRGGRTEFGVVADIKIKNVIVDTGTTKWRVPASMLTKV